MTDILKHWVNHSPGKLVHPPTGLIISSTANIFELTVGDVKAFTKPVPYYKKPVKQFATDAIWNHLQNGIEADRKILAKQWETGNVNPKIKERYENNLRKLKLYEEELLKV